MVARGSMKAGLVVAGLMAVAAADAAGAVSLFAARNDRPGGNRAEFTSDARFENWDIDGNAGNGQQAGWLARTQNATPINPPGGASNSVLPQFERATLNFSAGSTTPGVGTTYSLHMPGPASGLPASAGGTGIHTGLLATPGLAASQTTQPGGSINVPWANSMASGGAPPVLFEISRAGSAFTVRIGDASGPNRWDHVWSTSTAHLVDVNAIQLRLAAGGSSRWTVSDLAYNGQLMPASQNSGLANGLFMADNDGHTLAGNREIFLWEGGSLGDFTLSGAVNLGWSLNRPTGNSANMQVRLLALDEYTTPAPEPASWLMLIAGFGAVGATLRRQRRSAAGAA